MNQIGRILIVSGIVLIIAGLILKFAGHRLNWFGNLPGDIKIVKENIKIYIPITTMILLSAGLSLLLYFIRKFF